MARICIDCNLPTGRAPQARRCSECSGKAIDKQRAEAAKAFYLRHGASYFRKYEGVRKKAHLKHRAKIGHAAHNDSVKRRYWANPELARENALRIQQRRRARLAGTNSPGVTREQWRRILAKFSGRCAYCPSVATTRDHVVPIAKGGLDAPENVVPACGRCNSSKGAKDLATWLQERRHFGNAAA